MAVTDGFEDFVAIVEHGSVSAAARALGVPRATLSRRLARLEGTLGVRLLHRTTRTMQLTRAGQTFLVRARRVVAEAKDAVQEVARFDEVPRGLVRISIPPGAEESAMMAGLLEGFLAKYPEVSVEILATSRFVDVVTEGFDLAIRAGPPKEDGLVSRTLWRLESRVVAAAGLIERRGLPTPSSLGDWPCLVGLREEGGPVRTWPLRDGGRVAVDGRLSTNDLGLRRRMVAMGHGLALLPDLVVAESLRAGELVAVCPEVGVSAVLRIVFPERAFLAPKVRAFVDHAVSVIPASLGGESTERTG